MMRAIKKINNNVALAVNQHGDQFFLVGSGLGFGKFPIEISEKDPRIEHVFVSTKYSEMLALFKSVPSEIITCTKQIIEDGKKIIQIDINANILFSLSDHIHYALDRAKENLKMENPLQYEIRHMYPKEMEAGLHALDVIEKRFHVRLDKGEAAFIALHFVNAELGNGDMQNVNNLTEIIHGVLNIVKYHFHIQFDEESINFTRFVTHIRYFIIRQSKQLALSNENEGMYEMMCQQYPDISACVEKIATFLKTQYAWDCSIDEKLYLMLHIQRLTTRN